MNWPRLCSKVPNPPWCNVIQPVCRRSRMMPLSNVSRQAGVGQLRGNVLSRWAHSSSPVGENGRNWAMNMMDSAFSRFTFCVFFVWCFLSFGAGSETFFGRLRLRLGTKCSDGPTSGRNVLAPTLAPHPCGKAREMTWVNWTERRHLAIAPRIELNELSSQTGDSERTFQPNWWLGNWTVLTLRQTVLNLDREDLVSSRTLPALMKRYANRRFLRYPRKHEGEGLNAPPAPRGLKMIIYCNNFQSHKVQIIWRFRLSINIR